MQCTQHTIPFRPMHILLFIHSLALLHVTLLKEVEEEEEKKAFILFAISPRCCFSLPQHSSFSSIAKSFCISFRITHCFIHRYDADVFVLFIPSPSFYKLFNVHKVILSWIIYNSYTYFSVFILFLSFIVFLFIFSSSFFAKSIMSTFFYVYAWWKNKYANIHFMLEEMKKIKITFLCLLLH